MPRFDAGVRVVGAGDRRPTTDASRKQAVSRIPIPKKIIQCLFRGSVPIGKLVCNCSGAAVVWECCQPEIVARNGMCIPVAPGKWMDGPLRRVDGTITRERYIPWPGNGAYRSGGIMLCKDCPHRKIAELIAAPAIWQPQPSWNGDLRYVRNQDLANDTMELIPQLPPDLAGVIGIPVSGMIPAAYLSRMLCLPLYSFDHKEGVVSVGDGRRSRSAPSKDGKYLVVDDTVYSGAEMQKARKAMKEMDLNCIFAVVYTKKPEETDLYAVHAPGSVILEWNIFNSATLTGRTLMRECEGGIATDFDGVICEEPQVNDVREPEKFQWWLANARPQYIPRKYEIPLVISFRIEPWRAATEAWMQKWGVKAKTLALHSARTVQDRERDKDRVVSHKAKVYRESKCTIMFESDSKQARIIAESSGKTVIVPSTGEIMYGKQPVHVEVRKYDEIKVKNLLFHCCPLKANDGWRKNVEKIIQHIGVFNGKKVVAIATGGPDNRGQFETHGEDVVREAFKGHDIKFISTPNDRILRERVSFVSLLLEVANTNKDEATFFAHTKGNATTMVMKKREVLSEREIGAIRWRNVMYAEVAW